MRRFPTMTREQAAPLFAAGLLRLAFLYEPDHAPRGTRFVYVRLTPDLTRFYRVLDASPDKPRLP